LARFAITLWFRNCCLERLCATTLCSCTRNQTSSSHDGGIRDMNPNIVMVAKHASSSLTRASVTISIALLFALASTSTTAYAKKQKVKYGTLEITTTPGGLPLRIDGQAQGDTSTTVRVIELDPGHHNV